MVELTPPICEQVLKVRWMEQDYELVDSKDYGTPCGATQVQEETCSTAPSIVVVRDTH
jgi:hypothetical protein